jgi:hypothetical protein
MKPMKGIPFVPKPPRIDPNGSISRTLLLTVIGTTISIILTFGTSQLLQTHRKAKDRKMTAMMVMGNIESYASELDDISFQLGWRDTLATILLAIPQDSLDDPKYSSTIESVVMLFGLPSFTYDNTAEQIFSNTIETWKNMGNFQFISNVGDCFSAMHSIQEEYMKYANENMALMGKITQHPDQYPGNSRGSKILLNPDIRVKMRTLHRRTSYYKYLAEYMRYLNAINMKLMDVTEEKVLKFVNEKDEEVEVDRPIPYQQNYNAADIDLAGIKNIPEWIDNHHF